LATGKETDQPREPAVLPLVTWYPSACSRRLVGPPNCLNVFFTGNQATILQSCSP